MKKINEIKFTKAELVKMISWLNLMIEDEIDGAKVIQTKLKYKLNYLNRKK